MSQEYGLKVGKAIQLSGLIMIEGLNRYRSNYSNFHNLRLYARGEQSIQKYKDELSINGDLSYLNLDWKPIPIIPKFVDIVVNGIAERTYDIKAFSQDPYGVDKRTNIWKEYWGYAIKQFDQEIKAKLGIDLKRSSKEDLPGSRRRVKVYTCSLDYKQAVELAEEQALNVLIEGNKYELTKKRFYYDLTVLGIGAVKTNFKHQKVITIDYVDPANLVYSYTDSPYFDDIYYVGEVKSIPVNELVKQFPDLTEEDVRRHHEK